MRKFYWRTGGSGIYVDSNLGNDLLGDGSQQNPYQTLGRAWRGRSSKPGTIVCKGRFSEDMADGNHSAEIRADYYGAATFDGEGQYMIYGFSVPNMIIMNCCLPSPSLAVSTGSFSLAGVGRALYGSNVGYAYDVYGPACPQAFIGGSPLYFGAIGGNSSVKNVVFWKPKRNPNNLCWYITYGGGDWVNNITVYDVPITNRQKCRNGNNTGYFGISIFSKCDFYLDEPIKFNQCLFTSDCGWYYNGTRYDSSIVQDPAAQGILGINISESLRPKFTNCIFTDKTAEEIFNNPEKGDMTLKLGTEAVGDVNGWNSYYGAMPPAFNIPIKSDSTGVPGSWDENSASGIITVTDDRICIDETSTDRRGEIYSKVIKLDINKYSIGGIFAKFSSKWNSHKVRLGVQPSILGRTYTAGESMPIGKYIVIGEIIYRDANFLEGSVITVLSEGDTFLSTGTLGSKVIEITDPNLDDVCWIRFAPAVFAKIRHTDPLQAGGVYYNMGTSNVMYRSRIIAPGESFVAVNDTDTFVHPVNNPDYEIGIIFDDTRVPTQEWIPAQLFGEFFVYRIGGVVQKDSLGVPISSGNLLSFQATSSGGYLNNITKSVIGSRYVQLRIKAEKDVITV